MTSKRTRASHDLLNSARTKPSGLLVLTVVLRDLAARISAMPACLVPLRTNVAVAFWSGDENLLIEAGTSLPATTWIEDHVRRSASHP
ncbi:hypothetical protein [Microvirga sp. CF3016]|uniref:hypothetical protein n=1 Tax=Microvirga sp. CF3016 TaxID=3110181 RepID=UPI002E7936A8|nr:hypothetical protein [Microvirga sp. CF3016]MEE1612379.1 hypothetical protein [Microvirga sp. CF3016]